MGWTLLKPLNLAVQALSDQSSPRQLAAGLALGMVAGLVPKGNLTAVGLMMLLLMVRVNLGAGLLSACVCSWLGVLVDPWTHRLGLWLLEHESLLPLWTALYNMPLVPWTGFNNTVVLGSLVSGSALFYPVYRLSRPPLARYAPLLRERLQRYRLVRLLRGAEWGARLKTAG